MYLAHDRTPEAFHLPKTPRIVRLELLDPFHGTQVLDFFVCSLPPLCQSPSEYLSRKLTCQSRDVTHLFVFFIARETGLMRNPTPSS